MINTFSFGSYILVYNGQIYNTKELSETLKENGFTLNSHSDTEVLLKSYIHYGKNVVNHLNGIFAFAIWDTNNNEIFLARDHFGVKPLFYTKIDETLVFSSEIKALFQYPGVKKVLNEQSISELFGIGPAHTSGTTIFKNIYEIKPAHFGIFNKNGFNIKRYWKLKSEKHVDTFEETCEKLKFLLNDAITRQLVSDMTLCTFLSGGLDSSIITKFASDYCEKEVFNVPKSTFFNLNEEKRIKIEKALKTEFSRGSFEEASVSNIVTNAQIPRGSFYQYFEDKEDAIKYFT